MDYVLGSVAALVTGNVTPSRPRTLKRALTPTKHQQSPNVTPKSEFVDDRSIFLSPSMQKKKAIVKKSPKRIFQNPDLETTENGEGNVLLTSPKADKVKKHLKDDLDSDISLNTSAKEPKSPKIKDANKRESISGESANKANEQHSNENTPKKKKRKNKSVSEIVETSTTDVPESAVVETTSVVKSPKKKKQRNKSVNDDDEDNKENANNKTINEQNDKSSAEQKDKSSNLETTVANKEVIENASPKKKNKKRKKKSKQATEVKVDLNNEKKENDNENTTKKKNRKRKKSKSQQNKLEATETDQLTLENEEDEKSNIPTKKSKIIVNPNAVTDKESDSEHESDNEIESENEEINKKVFDSEPVDNESSDEEEDDEKTTKETPQKEKGEQKKGDNKKKEINVEDDIKRTLFVGNVPFSPKCKKEIKKIFSKHGQIETIRIRTVPVKDGRYTPKLAVIKNELHPERTTVNVYIKYADEESLEKALAENNTLLNENHLRVSRSSHTGAEHDPKSSIFVGNLPFAMEDEALRQKFENCGEIESVRIIRDKKTNAGKGFGYVNFTSKDGVELALQLTEEDLTVKNRIIRVKRCTQSTDKKKQPSDKGGFKKPFNQRPNPGNQRVQNGPRPNQGGPRSNQGGQRGNQGGQRGNQGGQRGNQGGQRGIQGGQRGNQGGQRWNQGGQRQGTKDEAGRDGAHRRVMQKRKSQDGGGDGPANKKQKNATEPIKEKKTKKEFVGMTAEKKKKRKFDKGQKKKKTLSEILTKQ